MTDTDLQPGARNAIRVCLNVQPHERVTVITDRACREIADALAPRSTPSARRTGCSCSRTKRRGRCRRCRRRSPRTWSGAQVSIFAARAQANELRSRMQMTDIVNRRRMRHAHMVNITRQIMIEGMRADYGVVDRISRRVIDIVQPARTIRATTPAGSDMTATLNPDLPLDQDERPHQPGEVGQSAWRGGLHDARRGQRHLRDRRRRRRLALRAVRPARAHAADDPDREESPRLRELDERPLRDDFWRYTHTDENSDRVGEFAIGTNVELQQVIGQILQDEKFPGIHIAFGNPYGAHTGADWYSSTHIDVVGTQFDIWVDDEPIMQRGQFLIARPRRSGGAMHLR